MPVTADQRAEVANINSSSYKSELGPEVESGLQLLMKYTGMTQADAKEHVQKIRAKAWSVFPYGSIGAFWFLRLVPVEEDIHFKDVVSRLSTPGSTETFLEVGCCLGVVIRYLIALGVESERLNGTDLHSGFLECGYELFLDKNTTKATYIAGDMQNEDDGQLEQLRHNFDIIYAASFFHLFEKDGQVKVAKRMAGFLKNDSTNAVIFGWNEGRKVGAWRKYILNAEDWSSVWDEVGEATGTRWRTTMLEDGSSNDWIKTQFIAQRI